MAIVRYDPFRLDFPELFSWLRAPEPHPPFVDFAGESAMRVEEFTEDDQLVIRAELPGVDPDKDIEVTVAGGMLTIRAERHEEKTEGDRKKGYRSEFRYGALVRTMPLPAGVDETDVKASYADGILEVRMPLGTLDRPSARIPVRRG